jgi:hypothetical protein
MRNVVKPYWRNQSGCGGREYCLQVSSPLDAFASDDFKLRYVDICNFQYVFGHPVTKFVLTCYQINTIRQLADAMQCTTNR